MYDPKKHTKEDGWKVWKKDVRIAEKILIHKYSPNYNIRELSNEPKWPYKIRLVQKGQRGSLGGEDNIPKDFHEW